MEGSEPKWVNPILNSTGVNSLRLGGPQIVFIQFYTYYIDYMDYIWNNKTFYWLSLVYTNKWIYTFSIGNPWRFAKGLLLLCHIS